MGENTREIAQTPLTSRKNGGFLHGTETSAVDVYADVSVIAISAVVELELKNSGSHSPVYNHHWRHHRGVDRLAADVRRLRHTHLRKLTTTNDAVEQRNKQLRSEL